MPLRVTKREITTQHRLSAHRAKPSARLILLVVATNQIAAVSFDSSPYLLATLPSPIRDAAPARPFKFTALRPPVVAAESDPESDEAKAAADAVTSKVDPATVHPDSLEAVLGLPPKSNDAIPHSGPLAAHGNTGPTTNNNTGNGNSTGPGSGPPGSDSPGVFRPEPVSLDDLLPYFYASPTPVSRATYQQK